MSVTSIRGVDRSTNGRAAQFGIVTHGAGEANTCLAAGRVEGFDELRLLSPIEALALLRPGDVALGRLDVRKTVDGIEDGLWALSRLAASGVTVFNPPDALVAAHDKLATARSLAGAGLPHPRTEVIGPRAARLTLDPPIVLKPRFGSWGRDVTLCADVNELAGCLAEFETRSWFHLQGALVQELVRPLGHDLRILVAAGQVVGAIKRVAAPGEWRTNIALGGTRMPVVPPPAACELAIAATAAIGADLVAVDLLPTGPGRFCVIELNGAADFGPEYSFGTNVFDAVLEALARAARRKPEPEPQPGVDLLAPESEAGALV
jgi:RimK family alpha-L-glutamate ligase